MTTHAYGVSLNGDMNEIVHAMNTIKSENLDLRDRVLHLHGQVEFLSNRGTHGGEAKHITDKKGFEKLDKFDGAEKDFTDWEFKLHQYIRSSVGLESYLDDLKELVEEPSLAAAKDLQDQVGTRTVGADTGKYDEDIYSILSLLTKGSAFTLVKNVRDRVGYRGSVAWYQITREVAGRSGIRLERLSDRVHHPPKITSYSAAQQLLASWEAAVGSRICKTRGPRDIRNLKKDSPQTYAPAGPREGSRT